MEKEKSEFSSGLLGKFMIAGTGVVLAALGGVVGIEISAIYTGGSFNETAELMLATTGKPMALLNYIQLIETTAILTSFVGGLFGGMYINKRLGLDII